METSPIELLLCALLGICTPRHEYVVVPPAEHQLDLADPQEEGRADIVIRIDETNQLVMDGEEVSLETLRSVLNAKAKEHPDAVVLVTAHPYSKNRNVVEVMNEVHKSDLGDAVRFEVPEKSKHQGSAPKALPFQTEPEWCFKLLFQRISGRRTGSTSSGNALPPQGFDAQEFWFLISRTFSKPLGGS